MGSINHGQQNISWTFHEELTALDFNKRNIDICPRGIYSGGHLTKVSNTEVTLSPFSLEIGDDSIQISCKSFVNATLNSVTLDSGNIASATPYLVFRWAYEEGQPNNYVEVHAISSVSGAQANDIIIGKCIFAGATLTGFDYTDRTFLNVQNIFLKVEPSETTEMYVWVRAGRIQTSPQYYLIPEQKVGPFSVPNSPNSRIDLVYVDTDGTVKVQQGTVAVSPIVPAYNGKLVLAQVRVVNGDTSIPASRITDVRSFLTGYTQQATQVGWNYSGATIHSENVTTTWTEKDLTGIVGAGRSMLFFYAGCIAGANRGLYFKPQDEADASYNSIYSPAGTNKVWDQGLVLVHTNNGKIKIRAHAYTTLWTIKLIGYQNFVE